MFDIGSVICPRTKRQMTALTYRIFGRSTRFHYGFTPDVCLANPGIFDPLRRANGGRCRLQPQRRKSFGFE